MPVNENGPTRRDLKYRVGFAIAGLGMTSGALAIRGLPAEPGGWEAVSVAMAFFGGTLIWAMRGLKREDLQDEP